MPELNLPDLDARVLQALCGADNEILKRIESFFGVQFSGKPGKWKIEGGRAQEAEYVITTLAAAAQQGPISCVELEGILRDGEPDEKQQGGGQRPYALKAGKRHIQGKTHNQRIYLEMMQKHVLTIAVGPAGSGKTYLAVAAAVAALQSQQVERIILTRPAVEAGERLGFLPGDLQQKVDPYLRPLFDALSDMLGLEKMTALMEAGRIEIAPLAYMRGRTLNDAFVILDEAQNTTHIQMKMFLTRLGFSSRMVVTGDVTQVDLDHHKMSGLLRVLPILEHIKDIATCRLGTQDVVRHPLVEKIVNAYEAAETKP